MILGCKTIPWRKACMGSVLGLGKKEFAKAVLCSGKNTGLSVTLTSCVILGKFADISGLQFHYFSHIALRLLATFKYLFRQKTYRNSKI